MQSTIYRNQILTGDAREQMIMLAKSGVTVPSIITSPPYLGHRLYGSNPNQIGQEPTAKQYLENLWSLMDAAWNVLDDWGTAYVVIGDTMSDGSYDTPDLKVPSKSYMMIPSRFAIGMIDRGWILRSTLIWHKSNARTENQSDRFSLDYEYIFMFAKRNRPIYWTNKSDDRMVWKQPPGIHGIENIDWYWKELDSNEDAEQIAKIKDHEAKNGAIPKNIKLAESVYFKKDTLWKAHDYYFNTQYRSYAPSTIKEFQTTYHGKAQKDYKTAGVNGGSDVKRNIIKKKLSGNPEDWKGSLMRCVWRFNEYTIVEVQGDLVDTISSILNVTTSQFRGAHFASYPVQLVDILLQASVPEFICPECKWMSHTIYEEDRINTRPGLNVGKGKSGTDQDPNARLHRSDLSRYRQQIVRSAKGYSFCEHKDKVQYYPGTVLDPCCGSGTTLVSALANGRSFIGIDLNPDYVAMSQARLKEYTDQKTLF